MCGEICVCVCDVNLPIRLDLTAQARKVCQLSCCEFCSRDCDLNFQCAC